MGDEEPKDIQCFSVHDINRCVESNEFHVLLGSGAEETPHFNQHVSFFLRSSLAYEKCKDAVVSLMV